MSDDSGTDKTESAGAPPKEKEGCLSRITPVTTPGCASCLTSIFLVTTVFTVWMIFWFDQDNVPWRHSMSWWRILIVLGLVILIPWVVNRMLRLWLEGAPSPFPDLEYAWYAGLHALGTNGLSIASTPIYLILGSGSEQQERSLMSAAGLRLPVEGVPEGPAPIHWYANSEAIYLFCSDSSWTSALASLREELGTEAASGGLGISEIAVAQSPTSYEDYQSPAQTGRDSSGGPTGRSKSPDVSESGGEGDVIRGTIMLDQYMAQHESSSKPTPAADTSDDDRAENVPYRGTLMLDEPVARSSPAMSQAPASRRGPEYVERGGITPPSAPSREPVMLSPQYASASLQELQYLGQLIRRARQPVCPINGVLTLIQFESIHSSPAEMEELQKAIKGDLSTIQYAFQLRAPVTAMVVGLEKERGFRELVRCVGRERAKGQRFGRKFDAQSVPTTEELEALSAHVCGAFEDWAYTLFREDDALTRPGNTRLYELLSKVRCSWKARLTEILTGGFGCDPTKAAADESFLFSGCYFAATGETPDRQAFVKGVIDKLNDEQELIEWTRQAVSVNRRQGYLALAGVVATGILALSLLGMSLFRRS